MSLATTTKLWLADHQFLAGAALRLRNMNPVPCQADIDKARVEAAAKQLRLASGKVAVIPICGVIEQRMSLWGWLFGGCSTEDTAQALHMALASKDCGAIVLDVDSPGGEVYGVQELGDQIFAARSVKPVHAIANSCMASAAYWLGSCASQVCASPSADVGSVGVYAVHEDWSSAYAEAGVKCTIAKVPKNKAEFNDLEPLSDDDDERLQEVVKGVYEKFVKAVARNRGVPPSDVRSKYGNGRLLKGDEALSAGMIDKIMTMGDLMERLTGGNRGEGRGASAKGASVEVLRLRHQVAKDRKCRSL